MKNIIAIIFLLISFSVFSQDAEMLGYVNQYRLVHGKTPLSLSNKLTKLAKNQLDIIVSQDSLSHSKLGNDVMGEICNMGTSLPATRDVENDFIKFVKTNFKIVYSEPKNNDDVIKYVKLYIIYLFDSSPSHKAILLGNHKSVGISYSIGSIKYTPNYIEILNKKYYWKKIVSHYDVTFYSVMNFF